MRWSTAEGLKAFNTLRWPVEVVWFVCACEHSVALFCGSRHAWTLLHCFLPRIIILQSASGRPCVSFVEKFAAIECPEVASMGGMVASSTTLLVGMVFWD